MVSDVSRGRKYRLNLASWLRMTLSASGMMFVAASGARIHHLLVPPAKCSASGHHLCDRRLPLHPPAAAASAELPPLLLPGCVVMHPSLMRAAAILLSPVPPVSGTPKLGGSGGRPG